MLRHGHTLHLNGPILPALRPLFPSGMGIDSFGFCSIVADIASGSIGGGDDASSSSWRDTNNASASGSG